MNKVDGRTLSEEAQYEKRLFVVKLRLKDTPNEEVASLTGLSPSKTSSIWTKYLNEGMEGIKIKKRGRPKGVGKVLNTEQEQEIIKVITDKTPDQLKFKFALWTRKAVQELIKHLYKLEIPLRTLTDYLRAWGFTCQKPAKQAYEQQPALVREWLDNEYPKIQKMAKEDNAIIMWGDETGLENTEYKDRGFSPKGVTPIVKLNAKKSRINIISAISNFGVMRFMIYKDKMNAQVLISFLKRLIKDSKQMVYIILDNLRVHHAKIVKQWTSENSDKIRIFYLPPYSPELNPDEYLNGDLKRHVQTGSPARNEKALETKARGYLMKIQRKPKHVSNYFANKKVSYAG